MPKIRPILLIEDNTDEADLIQLTIEQCIVGAKVWVAYQQDTALLYLVSSTRMQRITLDKY